MGMYGYVCIMKYNACKKCFTASLYTVTGVCMFVCVKAGVQFEVEEGGGRGRMLLPLPLATSLDADLEDIF